MLIAGVDEVGYGALVGDVYAAAVILPNKHCIIGIKDSKKLTALQRQKLFTQICAEAVAWSIGIASHVEIDKLNILYATLLAMQRAINALTIKPDKVLVDGNKCPQIDHPVEAIVGGDATIEAIAAASIIAKVSRDNSMIALDTLYPMYGFAQHKGYGTKAHLQALQKYGALKQHRRSFAPVTAVTECVY